MLRLASVLYAIAGPTLMGIFMIAALVAGYDTLNYILIAVALGAALALPVAYYIATTIKGNE